MLNEIKFKKRAEKILNYQHKYDQIIIEKKIINDLQQSISALTSDLGNEIDKESKQALYFYIKVQYIKFKRISELESKNITKICDKMMNLKLLSIKDCNDMKSLRDFIKLNKVTICSI